jgi:predicted ATPase
MGSPLLWQGDPAGALAHLQQAIAHYSSTVSFPTRTQDPGVLARAHAALALWLVGRPSQAVKMVDEAVALARKIDHPFSLASALAFAALLHHWRRERDLARQRAEETIELSRRQHFPLWEGMGRLIAGWAAFDDRRGEAGQDDFTRALALLATTGTEVGRPQAMGLLADVERRRGRLQTALEIAEHARKWAEERAIGFWDAELLRLKGEILLARDEADTAAEPCFRKAIEIAQRQGAKSLELRAAMSLAHMHLRRGDARETTELLARVVESFEEGFDTLDLWEARELLQSSGRGQDHPRG